MSNHWGKTKKVLPIHLAANRVLWNFNSIWHWNLSRENVWLKLISKDKFLPLRFLVDLFPEIEWCSLFSTVACPSLACNKHITSLPLEVSRDKLHAVRSAAILEPLHTERQIRNWDFKADKQIKHNDFFIEIMFRN